MEQKSHFATLIYNKGGDDNMTKELIDQILRDIGLEKIMPDTEDNSRQDLAKKEIAAAK